MAREFFLEFLNYHDIEKKKFQFLLNFTALQ